ncbi:MAG: DUF5668 domain-containing protein [Clostridia bacterium]|jgi:thiol:disulfide interchange protein|nr:DUF5668 domain-containing protein [Clostridia bacterium]
MREWRVGTFTMGFALIALGIFLLLDLFGIFNGGYWAMRLWPVIIIFLGVEVLLYAVVANRKPEKLKIKYDFLSIVLVLLIGMASLGLWGFNEVMDRYTEETGRNWFQEHVNIYDNGIQYHDGSENENGNGVELPPPAETEV